MIIDPALRTEYVRDSKTEFIGTKPAKYHFWRLAKAPRHGQAAARRTQIPIAADALEIRGIDEDIARVASATGVADRGDQEESVHSALAIGSRDQGTYLGIHARHTLRTIDGEVFRNMPNSNTVRPRFAIERRHKAFGDTPLQAESICCPAFTASAAETGHGDPCDKKCGELGSSPPLLLFSATAKKWPCAAHVIALEPERMPMKVHVVLVTFVAYSQPTHG